MMAIKTKLFLLESGKNLSKEIQSQIIENLKTVASIIKKDKKISPDKEKNGGRILRGGQSTPFVWAFNIPQLNGMVIKPYKLDFNDILRHCIATKKFKSITQTELCVVCSDNILVKVMEVYGLGKFEGKSKTFPFLIQEYSKGTKFRGAFSEKKYVSLSALKDYYLGIMKKGFVIDLLPTNWRVIEPDGTGYIILEYIDLLLLNLMDKAEFTSFKEIVKEKEIII